MPAYGAINAPPTLADIPQIFDYLDRRYGPPDKKSLKKSNGEYGIRLIIEYLSKHKKSTCEEIAKYEFEKNISTKRLLKSITDDVRKNVENNLRKLRLVKMQGFRKIKRRHAKVYSLTPLGILYSIHLFGKLQWKENHEINFVHIQNIAKEYSDTLPKIFGKFKLFEKILGKKFEPILITPFNRMTKPDQPPEIFVPFLLREYIFSKFYQKSEDEDEEDNDFPFEISVSGGTPTNQFAMNHPDEFFSEQISLVFYSYLQGSIQLTLSNYDKKRIELIKKSNEVWTNKSFDEHSNLYKKIEKREGQLRDMAKQKWLKLMNEGEDLKNWYDKFVEEVSESKRREYLELKQYHSATFSSTMSYRGWLY